MVVTFKLRDGAVWSDGTPITAQTFVDSWLYTLNPDTASNYAYMIGMIVKGADAYNTGKGPKENVAIRAVDDKTFEVTLTGPLAYAVNTMAHYAFAPLPMHAIEQNGADWIKPGKFVGNGPFVLETWTPQEKITVVPNDLFWNKDNVFLSRITFLPIEDTNTSYQKFKAGEIDWDTNPNLALLDEIKLRSDFQVAPQLSSYYYYFNMNDPTLKDVRVRKALTMAVDREELVNKVTRAGQVPADAFTPPMTGYTPAKGNPYNVAEAQRLLAEAGYPNGEGFPKLTVIYNTLDSHKSIAEYIQQIWKKNLNIDVELQNLEWATFLDTRQNNNFEIARAGWTADYMDPSNFLELLLSTSGNNDGRYNNPEYDALLKKASTLPMGDERNDILMQAEDILITQDQALLPLYFYVSQNLIDTSKWDGWHINPLDIHPYVGIKLKN